VVYHRIGERTGSRERELVPAHGSALFEAQLDLIEREYRVVPPSALRDAAARRRRGEPFPLAITFDDDLASHAGLAAGLLRRRGLPAAFFVSGASLTAPHEFWWERLQRVVDTGRANGELVEAVLGDRAGDDARTPLVKQLGRRIEAMTGGPRTHVEALLEDAAGPPPAAAGMRADDVLGLARAGFEIGFHTRRHELLPALGDEPLAAALTEGRRELEELAGGPMTAISYPHGKADARVAAAARRAGFSAGFTGRPESVRDAGDALLMGRVEPSFESAQALATQLERALRTRPSEHAR
jgi:peptidoglycan/xylan/chitin deacetylase (PgdA/CDA1 family)